MKPERWQRVEELFHAARERPSETRAEFLAVACGPDSSLRREVQSLLDQQSPSLLKGGLRDPFLASAIRGNREGERIGSYVLGPLIGSGGMGDVYRAHDEKLGREVAVKLLPGVLLPPERLARFEREARILATLNHPNIAAIYGIEEIEGAPGAPQRVSALVLELVEGTTLADRLAAGAIPRDEALGIATQIADGLRAAHQKGVVHRDLKPANIKISASGAVKVLDFGLAKIDAPEGAEPAALPLLATGDGVVLGTVAYMSPEQARGLAVDRRTDIWAFGCVLYEMLAGARAFAGDTAADVLGGITSAEPDWTRLPADTPARVRRVLRRCLTKDPERRLHDIADARNELADDHLDDRQKPVTSSARAALVAALVSLATAAAVIGLWSGLDAPSAVRPSPARLSIELPRSVSLFAIGRGSSVAISPDGSEIVYVGLADGRRQLYRRRLDGFDTEPIAGTEGATTPVFSPDGRWIAFIDNAPSGTLKKVPASGGTAQTIVDSGGDGLQGFSVQAAAWGLDDTIVFAAANPRARGLWRVPASGGTPARLTTPRAGELFHTWPQILPGGSVLYTAWSNTGFDGGRLLLVPLAGGEPALVVERGSYGRVGAGEDGRAWLIFARPEGLLAARFDPASRRLSSSPVPVLDGVLVNMSGGAQYAVARGGLLAYVPGGLDEVNKEAVWVDRRGSRTPIGVIPGLGFQYRISPDGRRLARPMAPGPNRDLWIDDLASGRPPIRLTAGAVINSPIWTPDGSRVIYTSGVPSGNLHWRAADGSGVEERLTTSASNQVAGSVSPDGAALAYEEESGDDASDIYILPLRATRQPRLLLGTPFAELAPMFSRDGRWLAYQSNRSGSFEIYLRAVTGGGREIQVSKGGGWHPLWSADGRELYYRTRQSEAASGSMIAVSVDTTSGEPRVGPPRALFASTYQGHGDVAPDGRFLLLERTPQEASSRVIQLVLHWFDELEAKVFPRP